MNRNTLPQPNDPALSDPKRLAVIHFQVNDIWQELFGNGREGMVSRLARVETKVNERTRRRVADSATGGGVVGVLMLVATAIGKLVGVI